MFSPEREEGADREKEKIREEENKTQRCRETAAEEETLQSSVKGLNPQNALV